MKIYIYTFLLTLLIVFSWIAKAQDLTLDIEIDKTELIEGEPIYLLITLQNISSQVQKYSPFYLEGRSLDLIVSNVQGKVLQYRGPIFDYESGKTESDKLMPGESNQYLCSLTRFYYNVVEKNTLFPFPIVARLLPGNYEVKAKFVVEKKEIYSKELKFRIVSPIGSDAELFEILKEKFRVSFISGKNYDEKISFFDALNKNYSQSVFTPHIMQYLSVFYSQKGDVVKANLIIRDLIKKYPNSGYALEAFRTMKFSNHEKEKFLNEIKLSNSQSRVVKFGENILKKIN